MWARHLSALAVMQPMQFELAGENNVNIDWLRVLAWLTLVSSRLVCLVLARVSVRDVQIWTGRPVGLRTTLATRLGCSILCS